MKILYILLFHIIILLIYIIHNKTEYFRIQIREIDYKSIKARLDKKANGETSGADTKTSANTVTDPWCSNPWGPEATDKQKDKSQVDGGNDVPHQVHIIYLKNIHI